MGHVTGSRGGTFAAVGDVHGMTHTMVRTLQRWEARTGRRLDFVVQVGDFEPHRDEADLRTMHGPAKHRFLGDFPDFFTGRHGAAFPWPVYFIGGNHEPYGWLDQHVEGATLMHNLHYMGRAGWQDVRGLRVVGLSGIFIQPQYGVARPGPELCDQVGNKHYIGFNDGDVTRALDAERAELLLVHEWPADILDAEDRLALSGKTHRRRGDPGNEHARLLLDLLKPRLVFCGHMHARFHKVITLPCGHETHVHALGHVKDHDESFACFTWSTDDAGTLRFALVR